MKASLRLCSQTETHFGLTTCWMTNWLQNLQMDVQFKHKPVVLDRRWLSGVFLPLRSQHRVVGVIGAYSPRRSGFNNLDENIVTRCAEQIAAYFVVHRARQRNSTLVQKVTELGKEIAAAQYSVFGSVHDAINASLAIRNNFDFIVPTTPTKQFFDAAKDHSERLKEVLGKLRSDVRNPRDIPLKIRRVNLSEFTLERLNAPKCRCALEGD